MSFKMIVTIIFAIIGSCHCLHAYGSFQFLSQLNLAIALTSFPGLVWSYSNHLKTITEVIKVFKMYLRQLRQPRFNLTSDFSTDPLLKFKVPATG